MTASARCPSEATLSRAFSESEDAITDHVAECQTCSQTWRELEALSRLGKQLPGSDPSVERIAALKSRVLASMAAERHVVPKRSRTPVAVAIAASLAAAAAAVAAVVLVPMLSTKTVEREPASDALATVRASKEAVFTHRLEPREEQRQEIIELSDGRIELVVEPLALDRRFRVITADGEIEVRGSSFTVSADHGRLLSVEVIAGLAEVRPREGVPVTVAAGQRWAPPVVAPKPAPRAPPKLVPPSPKTAARAEIPPSATAREPDPAEAAFLAGWRSFKAGDHLAAAESFGEAARDPDRTIAEDAEYWRAIAFAKAGHGSEAVAAMRLFLERRPSSSRTGEMSVMLGRQLVERGEKAEARAWFERALDDAAPDVREHARKALRAIE